jgi:hypothetical protein
VAKSREGAGTATRHARPAGVGRRTYQSVRTSLLLPLSSSPLSLCLIAVAFRFSVYLVSSACLSIDLILFHPLSHFYHSTSTPHSLLSRAASSHMSRAATRHHTRFRLCVPQFVSYSTVDVDGGPQGLPRRHSLRPRHVRRAETHRPNLAQGTAGVIRSCKKPPGQRCCSAQGVACAAVVVALHHKCRKND